ncbi:alanine--tRNA ligase [Candidatus Pacearchaeota archaeon]|nr:alanine--tRNA ligase [Candidatus Pacearchaeota archaeon]
MNRKQLIKKYIEFFKKKKHKEIPNSSLIPVDDPTVLFTTAGMHPLVPYFLGQKHPLGKKLVNVQKCIRTQDIEEVGDSYHHTFFEMLGNWSLGDYWKKEAIEWSFEFLTKELKIPIEKLAVSVFKGDKDASRDNESYEIWRRLGIPDKRIAFLPKENNWWGPAGKTGPCGPDTEMFFYKKDKVPETFNPKDENWIEIWNDVLMQYEKNINGKYREAKQKNIDTGMGVERTVAVLNKLNDNYLTDCFLSIIKKIEKISNKKYSSDKEITRSMRIIADHIKASVFIIADGVKPGNIERGYVLRRLIRRAIRFGRNLGLKEFVKESAMPVFEIYDDYKELKEHKNEILNELAVEEKKFLQTLEKGIAIFNKITNNKKTISGKDAFLLYQSYGFPLEITKELAKEKGINVDKQEFLKEEKKHQELSRKATEGIFKSGLADYSEKTVRMHTATHLLNESLRRVLGDEVKQRGSNITPERLRFDFSFGRKLTEEKIKKVEDLVNEKIKQNLDVVKVEMPLEQALNSGAQAEFGHKYPDIVSVYTIIDKKEKQGWFSKEICTGPHVKNTKEIGKFKILKEESVAAGIRRIKAVVLESGK